MVHGPVKNWDIYQDCPKCEAVSGDPCRSKRPNSDSYCAYPHDGRVEKEEFRRARGRPRKDMDPIGLKILELISEDWMSYNDLIAQISPFIPPGIAWRTAEDARQRSFKARGEEVKPRRNDNKLAIILSGSRTYARKIIQALKGTGRIEIEYENKSVYKKPIRIRLSESEAELRKQMHWENS